MDTTSLNISLAEIRQEAQMELCSLLQAGLNSGISDQSPDEVFAELKSYIDSKL